jgi:hypothetical protein
MKVYSQALTRRVDRPLPLDAQSGNAEAHGLAGAEIPWRLLSQADAGRGAGGNHIPELEPHELANVRNQVRDVEEHGAGVAALKAVASTSSHSCRFWDREFRRG